MTTTQIGAQLHQQRYRIRQQLGKGGFGAVYLADDTRLPGRQVALKENLGVNPESQGQFKREALLLARLRHPNLPQVTDYFFDPAITCVS
jgi:serine/threonine-protein kinase